MDAQSSSACPSARDEPLSVLREFPQHAKAVERLDEAISYAESTFEHESDRERFVVQTRERLTERIAEGRFASPDRTRVKERGAKTR
jgi:Tfp pilus assembly protein PilP